MTSFAEGLDSLHHGSFASRRGCAEPVVQEVTESERAIRRKLDVSVRHGQQVRLRQGELGSAIERYTRHELEVRDGATHGTHGRLDPFEAGVALLDAKVCEPSRGGLEGVAAGEVSRDADRAAAGEGGEVKKSVYRPRKENSRRAAEVAHMSLPIPTTLESLPINPPSPPEDPPGVRRGSYGLFDTPKRAVLHSNESIV